MAVGFVVKAHVAGNHRITKRAAGLGDAVDRLLELAHNARFFRVAEIQAIGDRQRSATDRGDIAPGLGDRLLGAFVRVGLTVSRGAIGGDRQRFIGPVDPDHRGVAARPADRVGHHHVVVLLPDPAP